MEGEEKIDHGWLRYNGKLYHLRDECYRTEDNDLVFPLDDGTDLVCKKAWPASLRYEGLECGTSEECKLEMTQRYSRQTYWPGPQSEVPVV